MGEPPDLKALYLHGESDPWVTLDWPGGSPMFANKR
jgi:hypothetical protein